MEVAAALVEIHEQTDVAEARRRAIERGAQLGFDEQALGRVSIAVTEAATNLLKHAGGGNICIGPAAGRGGFGLQLLALDRGRGMANVPKSLRDGYSTAGTHGTGLGAISRAASLDLFTVPGKGTVLAGQMFPNGVEPLALGGVSLAMPGESECGDGWSVWSAGALTSVVVADGLGHGPSAHSAAAIALATFRRHAERSAAHVVEAIHGALRSTRGAAIAVAELDQRQQTLHFCGIGNIGALIVHPDGSTQHLVSLSGIAGHVMRRVQPFSYAWPRGSVLVMFSDGIGSHWSLSAYEGLSARRADVIAGVLMRDQRRGRDDATVVAVKSGEEA